MANRRKSEQQSLDFTTSSRRTVGRVERRVAASIAAAKRGKHLEARDDGLCALAVELARTVDECSMSTERPQPYALAGASRELREVLTRLRLDPSEREAPAARDPFEQFLERAAALEAGAPASAEGHAPPS